MAIWTVDAPKMERRNVVRLCILVVVAMTYASMGCRPGFGFDQERYKRCVRSGFKVIAEAKQIEATLGDTDHFITYYGSRPDNDWQTEVFFGERYVLTMEVPISLSPSLDEVASLRGKPTFLLREVERVLLDPDGTVGANFNPKGQMIFGLDEWKKVYAAKGDFSVLGRKVNVNPVPNFGAYKDAIRRDRIKVP